MFLSIYTMKLLQRMNEWNNDWALQDVECKNIIINTTILICVNTFNKSK